MKFVQAWVEIARQNLTLKVVTVSLSTVLVALAFTTTKLALKAPLLIDRGCISRAVDPSADKQRSTAEIEAFLREAVPMRFNTDAIVKPEFLSADETKFREQEQDALKHREMGQKVIVNSVKVDGGSAIIDADRVISVGKIRSALPLPLTVSLTSIARSEGNPYGLMVNQFSKPAEEQGK